MVGVYHDFFFERPQSREMLPPRLDKLRPRLLIRVKFATGVADGVVSAEESAGVAVGVGSETLVMRDRARPALLQIARSVQYGVGPDYF